MQRYVGKEQTQRKMKERIREKGKVNTQGTEETRNDEIRVQPLKMI